MKSNLLLVITIFPLLIVSIVFNSPQATATPLKAGVAKIDLTPPMELRASLGGYGARIHRRLKDPQFLAQTRKNRGRSRCRSDDHEMGGGTGHFLIGTEIEGFYLLI